MNDQLVSFKTAILAKEKGFEEKCYHYYIHKYNNSFENLHGELYDFIVNNEHGDIIGVTSRKNSKSQPHIIIAPTQSLLQRWLREVHSILVIIIPEGGDKYNTPFYPWDEIDQDEVFFSYIIHNNDGTTNGGSDDYYDNYEEALEQGLVEALKLINK